VIKKTAARVAAVAILIGGLATTSLLDRDATNNTDEASNSPPETAPSPQFTVRWRPGVLNISGHPVSEAHEKALMRVIEESYPDVLLQTDFQATAVGPDAWASTIEQVLTAIAATVAATAEISTSEIIIRSVVAEEAVWQEQLESLTQALPANVSISVDRIVLGDDMNVAELCERAFSTFVPGPINFEESSFVFRDSAFPNMAKVVALAAACTEASIHITGHTDSSGPDAWNQQLSLERAIAVGDYIATKGIEADRLHTAGAGSSSPIATNATRYGRSFNRRIEIEFRSTPATSAAAAQY